MTFDHLAAVYERARREGSTTADALREVFALRCGVKLTDKQRDDIRRRCSVGETVKQLAFDFGVTYGYALRLCRGIPRPQVTVEPPPPLAHQVVLAASKWFVLAPGDIYWPHRRGRIPWGSKAVTARRAVALVLRDEGVSFPAIARALGRTDHTTALAMVKRGLQDLEAMRAATEIAATLGLSRQAEAA